MFKKILNKIREITPKQLVVAGVFTLALAGAVGLGLANRQSAHANEQIRDCDHGNSIINVAPCGALTPQELADDVRANKSHQKDLKAIYADARIGGLEGEADYSRFASEAKAGILKRTGDLFVDGELVATNAWTMGRDNYSGRTPLTIGGKTYYMSHPNTSFASGRQQLDVMVLFDNNGTVEIAIIEACGNPVPRMDKVKSSLDCKALNKVAVTGKKNTYKFNTSINKTGLAKVTKVEYFIDGKLWTTKNTVEEMTDEYTFTKASSEVSVKVHYNLPGGKSKVTEFKIECKKTIEVEQPFYACEKLIATARDESNRKFRFTVQAKFGNGATLKNVDFSVDGVSKNTGVTQKDAQGNIYQDYDFDDNVKHTIVAKVNFNVADKVESKLCQASVTPTKKPMCEVPGKENYPPEAPECKDVPKECKPGVPVGHPDCAPLPNTGPGSLVGLFAGTSIAGAAAHRIFLRFRSRD
ncbi:MAG: hypothetical protein ACREGD_03450 [Candidatus Saccharimonadales bacterium]